MDAEPSLLEEREPSQGIFPGPQHPGACRAGAASSSLLSMAQPAQHQPELSLGHHPSSGAVVLEGNKTTATIVVVKIIAAGNIDTESVYVYQALLLVP